MTKKESMSDTAIHYYAGWPGKTLCSKETSLPVSPITSIRYEHVTCYECLALLDSMEWPVETGEKLP